MDYRDYIFLCGQRDPSLRGVLPKLAMMKGDLETYAFLKLAEEGRLEDVIAAIQEQQAETADGDEELAGEDSDDGYSQEIGDEDSIDEDEMAELVRSVGLSGMTDEEMEEIAALQALEEIEE